MSTFYLDLFALLITGMRNAIAKQSAQETLIRRVIKRVTLESVFF